MYKIEIIFRVRRQIGPGLISKLRVFKEEWDRVHPEPIHSLLYPEGEDVQHLLPDCGVPVIEVWLFLSEGVVVELAPPLTPLPGRATKYAYPVCRSQTCNKPIYPRPFVAVIVRE